MQIQIPKPCNEQDFECVTKVLFQHILGDPGVKRHGRRGQKQFGVDITGLRDGNPKKIVGVQCKLKGDGNDLTEAEIRKEVKKALRFRPPLSEYIIVTTAPTDGKLDRLALELSVPESADHPMGMRVSVWGWETLQEEINQHPEAINAFDPSYSPWTNQIYEKFCEVFRNSNTISAPIQFPTNYFEPITGDATALGILDDQINEYAILVRNDPSAALPLLKRLLEKYGSTVPDPVQFRIVSNIAGCHLNLGDTKIAAEGFLNAFELDTKNPKAVANKALGLLLNEDWHTLRLFAEDHLQEYSNNAKLAAYYIHGLIVDEETSDPLVHVPDEVRNTPEVATANVRWLMKRGDDGVWWEAAQAAYKVYPQNDEILELYACALLEQVVTESVFVYGRGLSDIDLRNIQTAISIYEPLWSKIRDNSCEVQAERVCIPANLIVAYRISDLAEEAIRIGNEALIRFPQSEELRISLAAVFVERREYDRALDLIAGLEGNPQIAKMRLEIAMANEDWPKICDLVDNQLDSFPEKRRTFPVAMGVLANVELAPAEDRRSILEENRGDFNGDACALVVLAQCSRMHGFDDLARGYFEAAIEAVDRGDNGLDSRTSVAREALARGQLNTVVDTLHGFTPIDRMSPALLLLAQALVSIYPIHQRAVDFFEHLPSQIRGLHNFMQLEGYLYTNYGDPRRAIGPLSRVFEKKACIENLIPLITAYSHAGDREAVGRLLSDPSIDLLPGSSLDRLKLCHVLVDIGENERAIDLAYEALIDRVNSHDVVARYLKLVLELSSHFQDVIYDEVAQGLWVRFTSDQDKTYQAIVGETADRLWGERVDPSNTFLSHALGKKVGDKFEYTNVFNATEIWTISEIKPRWLRAFHYLSDTFNQRYPENKDFTSISVTKDDVPKILSIVRQYSEEKYVQAAPYLKCETPMAFIAGNSVGGTIAFADYLFSIEENVQAAFGTKDEQSKAYSWIKKNERSGAVIDALTAWRAAQFRILPILKKCLGPLVIPANEMATIRSMAGSEIAGRSRESVSVYYHQGEYVRHSITPEQKTERLDAMRGLIAEIEEECRIDPVVIPDELPDLVEQILSVPAGSYFTCSILAGEGKLLLCEDVIMRQWARELLNVKGIWLQAVLSYALENDILTRHSYSDVLVQLARVRHFHISIAVDDLISVFERDKGADLMQFEILCTALRSKLADRASHIDVAVEFINRIWSDDRYHGEQLTKPTSMVLNALLLPENNERDLWAPLVYTKLNSAPQNYFTGWCKEHKSSGPWVHKR